MLSNYPTIVAYHAQINIKSDKDDKTYCINVDTPDYEADWVILSKLSKLLGVKTVKDVLNTLLDKNVTFNIDGVKWNASAIQDNGKFEECGMIWDMDDIIST